MCRKTIGRAALPLPNHGAMGGRDFWPGDGREETHLHYKAGDTMQTDRDYKETLITSVSRRIEKQIYRGQQTKDGSNEEEGELFQFISCTL